MADIGGTHARFAIAELDGTRVAALGQAITLQTADHGGIEQAWSTVQTQLGPLPAAASIAIAGPVLGGRVKMTNGPWIIDAQVSRRALALEAITLVNDFGAVAHAVAGLPQDQMVRVAGPDSALPAEGNVSVIGPGTGLGVAQVRFLGNDYLIQASEGGHIGFAPQDEFDDRLVAILRAKHGRVTNEHVVAGPGIAAIYAVLGGSELTSERAIWQRGIARDDALAAQAVDRFCTSLGSIAGDYALAQGASAVALAGGLGFRLRHLLPASGFGQAFLAKPRYEAMMAGIAVKLIIHPEPGLFGAAAAFASEHP